MGTVREEQVVRLAGSLDVRTVGRVRQQLNELIDRTDGDVIVDLERLDGRQPDAACLRRRQLPGGAGGRRRSVASVVP